MKQGSTSGISFFFSAFSRPRGAHGCFVIWSNAFFLPAAINLNSCVKLPHRETDASPPRRRNILRHDETPAQSHVRAINSSRSLAKYVRYLVLLYRGKVWRPVEIISWSPSDGYTIVLPVHLSSIHHPSSLDENTYIWIFFPILSNFDFFFAGSEFEIEIAIQVYNTGGNKESFIPRVTAFHLSKSSVRTPVLNITTKIVRCSKGIKGINKFFFLEFQSREFSLVRIES